LLKALLSSFSFVVSPLRLPTEVDGVSMAKRQTWPNSPMPGTAIG
jgi:hypothetical protein